MKNTAQRKLPLQASRPAYRTLQGWALGTLIEQHAVRQCEHHGHARDRGRSGRLEPGPRNRLAQPFPGTSPENCWPPLMRSCGRSEIPARSATERTPHSGLIPPILNEIQYRWSLLLWPRAPIGRAFCGFRW